MKLNGWKWDFPLDRYHSGKCRVGSSDAQGEETSRVKELVLITGRITAPLFLSLAMERGFWVRQGGNGWAACAVSHRGRVPARILPRFPTHSSTACTPLASAAVADLHRKPSCAEPGTHGHAPASLQAAGSVPCSRRFRFPCMS